MTLEIDYIWQFLQVNAKLFSPTLTHFSTVIFMQQLNSCEISGPNFSLSRIWFCNVVRQTDRQTDRITTSSCWWQKQAFLVDVRVAPKSYIAVIIALLQQPANRIYRTNSKTFVEYVSFLHLNIIIYSRSQV